MVAAVVLATPSPRVRGEGGVRGLSAGRGIAELSAALRFICKAQNRGKAPSPSFASLTRPLPAQRGEVK
jgi:hypothetical protein